MLLVHLTWKFWKTNNCPWDPWHNYGWPRPCISGAWIFRACPWQRMRLLLLEILRPKNRSPAYCAWFCIFLGCSPEPHSSFKPYCINACTTKGLWVCCPSRNDRVSWRLATIGRLSLVETQFTFVSHGIRMNWASLAKYAGDYSIP